MIRRIVVAALVTACVVTSRAAAAEPGDGIAARTQILLNGMWEAAGPVGATWAPLRVPQPLMATQRPSAASYRLRFTVPKGLRRDRRALLVFEKAGHHVRVVLNDRGVGEHYGVRLPFSFDVSDVLREGENELSVWASPIEPKNARRGGVGSVDEAKAYDIFLMSEPSGWYPAGIFGDVALHLVPAVRVEDVFVRTSFREKTVRVTADVANHGSAKASVTVRTEVVTLDGAPTQVRLPDETIAIPPGGRASVERSAPFPDAIAWPDGGGGGTPRLYVARTSLLVDRRIHDLTTRRFAFREVWIEGRDLVLNGKRLRLAADIVTGVAARPRLTHLFHALRSVGVNAIQLHWDDPTESFYDLADEAGMLVIPALYCAGPPQQTRPVVAPPGWVEDMAREIDAWVRLRRGHPSIVLWAPYDMAPRGVQKADLEGFDRRVRAADPTRPIAGLDLIESPVGNAQEFVTDPRDPLRVEYEQALATSRREGKPLFVAEVATMRSTKPEEARALIERFGGDGVVGYGGLLVADKLFRPRRSSLQWPSMSGPDVRAPASGAVFDVVNWSDPSQPSFVRTDYGRLLPSVLPKAMGVTAAPLAFVRSPELLVRGPATCGGRGVALAAPLASSGGVERGTLLDRDNVGWLVLPEPGTYRVRIACGEEHATTVEAKGRPFSGEPGFGHLQEVRVGAAP